MDPNPKAPAAQRYKALANVGEYELAALVSPDGIHWQPLRAEPSSPTRAQSDDGSAEPGVLG
jgi:hypothetical protein